MPTLQRREDNSTGTIVGIIAGVVVLVIIFGVMICWATSSHQKSYGYRARRNVVHESPHYHLHQMSRRPEVQHYPHGHHMPLRPQMQYHPHIENLQHRAEMLQQHQQHMDPIQIQRLHLNVNNQDHDCEKQRNDKQGNKRQKSEDRSTNSHSPRRHRRRRSGARTSADIEEWIGHISHKHQHPHHHHQHQHHHHHHRSKESRSDRATLGQDSGTLWFNNDPFADLHLAYPARPYFPQQYPGYH